MPKVTLKHQTADGVVHTRKTARTYSHVIVAHNPADGAHHVTNWVGRPDLVGGALSQAQRYSNAGWTYAAEPLNGGTRVTGEFQDGRIPFGAV
jgi:hypothetical protein